MLISRDAATRPAPSTLERTLVGSYGVLVYVVCLAVFVSLAAFCGGFLVPMHTASGPAGPVLPAIAINLSLILLFGVQHAVMGWRGLKVWITRFIPVAAERSTFVLATCCVLMAMFALWQPMPQHVWSVSSPIARAIVWTVFAAGWLLVLGSSFVISHYDLLGLRQAVLHLLARKADPIAFRVSGPYRFVRHPLMLGFLLVFWSAPTMTAGRLLFALGMTASILAGVAMEERDLIRAFGEQYRQYRCHVPSILPLEAGPQSRRYRLKKLIRRHPIESAAIALAAASLVLLAAVSIFVASEQASQRARLGAQTVRSDAAADFARSVLESVDPAIARGQDTALLRQILDDAATRVTTELADHPEAAVDMLMTLGLAHWRISDLARAETLLASARPLFERLYERRSRRLGPTHEDTLTVANNLAVLLSDIGHDGHAAAMLGTVYEAQRAGLGVDHPRSLATAHNLAGALDEADDRARAISLLEETIEHKSRVLGPSHPSTLLSMSALGSLLSREGRSEEAEAMLRRALTASEATPDDPRRAGLLNSLGGVLLRQGRHFEAEPFVREAFELMTSLAGPDHPHALQLAANLASVLLTLDRPADARPVAHDAHARAIERLGLTHRTSIDLCVHPARALAHSGEADEARALLSRHRDACQSDALTDQHARIEKVMHEIEALSAPIEPGEPHG